jgi:hypothetical protein
LEASIEATDAHKIAREAAEAAKAGAVIGGFADEGGEGMPMMV